MHIFVSLVTLHGLPLLEVGQLAVGSGSKEMIVVSACESYSQSAAILNRTACVLTFDLDGLSVWHSMSRTDPTPLQLSQGRYGPEEGVQNLLVMLEEFNLPATFFVPAETAQQYSGLVVDIARRGFEIACHGFTHRHPVTLSKQEEWDQLQRSIVVLGDLLGTKPRGYRAPGYQTSTHTLELLAAAGLEYDSSMMDSEKPYVTKEGIVEITVSWSLDDWALYGESTADEITSMIPACSIEEVLIYEFQSRMLAGVPFIAILHPQLSGRVARVRAWRSFLHNAIQHENAYWTTMSHLSSLVIGSQ